MEDVIEVDAEKDDFVNFETKNINNKNFTETKKKLSDLLENCEM